MVKLASNIILESKGKVFELIKPLGRSSNCAVWLSKMTSNKKTTDRACKFALHTTPDKAVVQTLQQEHNFCKKFDCKHVRRTYEIHSNKEHTWLEMQYIPGQSVLDFINSSSHKNTINSELRVTDRLTYLRSILTPLARSIDYLVFQRRLLHRDIKPSNAIITTSGHVTLLDLSLASPWKTGDSKTTSGTISGSRGYKAPETYAEHTPNSGIDVYSFGQITRNLSNGLFTARAQNKNDAQLMRNCNARVEAVIEKATSDSPSIRYNRAIDLVRSLPDPRLLKLKADAEEKRLRQLVRY